MTGREEEMYQERQTERKRCTRRDRQRGRDVQGETDRE
jgi:hypothetical protein